MKFDDLVNNILNEESSIDTWHKAQMDKETRLHKLGTHMSDADAAYVVIHDILKDSNASKDAYIALGKELKDGGMGTDEYSLETLQKALEYAKYDGWEFDIDAIMDQLGGPAGYKDDYEREEQQDEYRGWPGDGSGEDDFADYNQMEGNDY
jgi:hypothetical protein